MICVKVLCGAKELQDFLNKIDYGSVLQILTSECYRLEEGHTVPIPKSSHIVRESTYTVIFEDEITLEELENIQNANKLRES